MANFITRQLRVVMALIKVIPSLFIFPIVALIARVAPSMLERSLPDDPEEKSAAKTYRERKRPRTMKV